MTLKLNNDYAVYTVEKQLLFSGSYQECLQYLEEHADDEDSFVDVDKTPEEYELADLSLDYTFED